MYVVPSQLYLCNSFGVTTNIPKTIFDSHALQLLDISSRELGVSSRSDTGVLGDERVLAVVDGPRLEAVVHH